MEGSHQVETHHLMWEVVDWRWVNSWERVWSFAWTACGVLGGLEKREGEVYHLETCALEEETFGVGPGCGDGYGRGEEADVSIGSAWF